MQINSDTVIVITGASSGVGKAMALRLSVFRPQLVIAARRAEALEATAFECRENGAQVITVVADMGVAAEVFQLAERAIAACGKIDVWINNAGVLAAGALDEVPDEINEAVIRINLMGYIRGAQAVLPYFKRENKGILINNISIGGWLPAPFASAYAASKFGLRGFSAALKGELSDYRDIHVVDLIPGFIDTPGIDHAANFTGKEIQAIPPIGDPQTVANAVVRAIMYPRPYIKISIPARVLQLSYLLFPALTRKASGWMMSRYLNNAKPTASTAGNVIGTVDFGTGIYGGPAAHPGQAFTNKKWAFAAAFVVGIVAVASSRRG